MEQHFSDREVSRGRRWTFVGPGHLSPANVAHFVVMICAMLALLLVSQRSPDDSGRFVITLVVAAWMFWVALRWPEANVLTRIAFASSAVLFAAPALCILLGEAKWAPFADRLFWQALEIVGVLEAQWIAFKWLRGRPPNTEPEVERARTSAA